MTARTASLGAGGFRLRSAGTALAVLLGAALLLAFGASSAWASASHHFAGKFSTGIDPIYPSEPCHVYDMDIDAKENVYALCGPKEKNAAVLKKFDKNGNPVPFAVKKPYIQGNAIVEDPYPYAEKGELGKNFSTYNGKIAVDTSSGPTAGYIYIISVYHIDVIKPSGEFAGTISPTGAFGIDSVATDADGNVYYNSGFKIDKRDRTLSVVAQLYASAENSFDSIGANDLAFDSTGAVWGLGTAHEDFSGYTTVSRYEADQFERPEQESSYSLGQHKEAILSPLVEPQLKAFGEDQPLEGDSIAVDRSDNDLFVRTVGETFPNPEEGPQTILQFSRGTPDELSHQIAAPIGNGSNVGPSSGTTFSPGNRGIGVSSAGNIFVAFGPEISKFAAGGPLPTIRDHRVALADVGHEDVTIRAKVELEGGGPIAGCEVVYGKTRNYDQGPVPCAPSAFGADTEVSADITGLETEQTYHWAVIAKNAEGTAYGIDRTMRPAAVLNAETKPPADLTDSGATFKGTLDPDGLPTKYLFKFGLAGELTGETGEQEITGSGLKVVSVPETDLSPGKEYTVELVASNALGTTEAAPLTFTVAGPPEISGVHATNVREAEADLQAQINPVGYHTTYFFEYGLTTNYGITIPVAPAEGDAGESAQNVSISEHLGGIEPGRTYHFRLVSKNEWGTTTSDDTTFNFFPETCPNEHVRQQTKSSFLPDCRAYELVSPGNAGGAQIYPGNEIYNAGNGFPAFTGLQNAREIQNTGLANNPPRFAFYAGLGAIPGLDAPNTLLDQYISTRTDQGWTTTYSGIPATAFGSRLTGHKTCSSDLSRCFDHFDQNPFFPNPEYGNGYENPRNGGWLYDVGGKKIGVAPTSFETVENGLKFVGDIRNSPDFSHLAFSSRNAVFADGGITEAPGSAYDNDLETGTVKLISVLKSTGEPLPAGNEGPFQFILIPPTGVSNDGSHILMETQSPEGGHRLYINIDDEGAIPVSDGKGVKFIAMSSDGRRVLFLAEQQLVAEDTDGSADVYEWNENAGGNPPSITLVSQGEGHGNSDSCKATWTEKCDVQILKTEDGDRSGLSGNNPGEEQEYQEVVLGGIDSKISSESGGVLFFSPERLAGAAPSNGKNLYYANRGVVHYVATVAAGRSVSRVQISPDGEHLGLITKAKLTSYDNAGFSEMYSYTPGSGRVLCVSCRPGGEPPTSNVEGSQNGPFMSDDGRLFFVSSDPLVPADSDPYHIPDVYEYVEGRPQLISSGTSSNGKAPGGAAQFYAERLGLESVSSSGQDVFFSTTDTLVAQDANGTYAKIYDARTNGGYPVGAQAAPCVAADECHGAGASAPAPLQSGTGSNSTGGNVPTGGKRQNKGKSHKKKQKAKKHRAKNRHHGSGGKR